MIKKFIAKLLGSPRVKAAPAGKFKASGTGQGGIWHLALIGFVLGWNYQGVSFDLALHFGTLAAVLVYYRKDLSSIPKPALYGNMNMGRAAATNSIIRRRAKTTVGR